ncbi:MBL fold metallo-hydrolase [Leifsonia sp. ZF2019]|uniref:MBL fold metallo-hydrolase n=1 Tax=Leifsonia sp. ZF2019 TaxID=2781978 RepID=UPI001CBDA7C7|nr:MBL fold metallo-hydrolase [Leifsonia sp. ZF2019]UAJ81116.1 MBL fold metallo-hydrolase [Leifsonia sp. ZF2019]
MNIGDFEIQAITDGSGTEQAAEIISRFSDAEAWRGHPEEFGHDGRWTFPVGGFLIRGGGRLILVDAGVGPLDEGGYTGGGLPQSLRANGVEPAQVTDVLFTHLHFDHVGWASVEGRAAFPRATYRAHRADWERFVDGPDADERVRRVLLPVAERFELFEGDLDVVPGVVARWTPGHTPGSVVVVVASRGERAVLLGDTVHSVVQLAEDDWTVVWDDDPVAASLMRNTLADEAAERGDLVVAAHFPAQAFGRVVSSGGRRRFVRSTR